MNKSDRYLITGGSGFLGNALIDRLTADGYQNLVALARDEGELIKLQMRNPHVDIITGDIADQHICHKACRGIDGVFHLAAYKHVKLAEDNVWQCVKSNIAGTMQLLSEVMAGQIPMFVFISTDKAANVNGTYGATKLIGERLIREIAGMMPDALFRIVRYGNVWGSTGSIATKWIPQITAGQEITVTDPEATRFFFSVQEAVDFIFDCINTDGPIVPRAPEIKAVRIGTVVDALMEVYGKVPVKVIGLQDGENLHETMDGRRYSNNMPQYTKDEFMRKFICPMK